MKELEIPLRLPIRFQLHEEKKKHLILFLHGYSDSASSFLRRLVRQSALKADHLAPNGPFPIPVRVENDFKEAYAWYFVDYEKNKTIISPAVPVHILSQLVETLGYEETPKTICGFSQGGYLAPLLAHKLKNVKSIIGIGCGYNAESYEGLRVSVTGIHGSEDEVVDAERSKREFEALGARQNDFILVPGMTHKINEAGHRIFMGLIDKQII